MVGEELAVFERVKVDSFGIRFRPTDGNLNIFGDSAGGSNGFEEIKEAGDKANFGNLIGFFDLRDLGLTEFLGIKFGLLLLLVAIGDEIEISVVTAGDGRGAGNSPVFGDSAVGVVDVNLALEGGGAGDRHKIVEILITGRIGNWGKAGKTVLIEVINDGSSVGRVGADEGGGVGVGDFGGVDGSAIWRGSFGILLGGETGLTRTSVTDDFISGRVVVFVGGVGVGGVDDLAKLEFIELFFREDLITSTDSLIKRGVFTFFEFGGREVGNLGAVNALAGIIGDFFGNFFVLSEAGDGDRTGVRVELLKLGAVLIEIKILRDGESKGTGNLRISVAGSNGRRVTSEIIGAKFFGIVEADWSTRVSIKFAESRSIF